MSAIIWKFSSPLNDGETFADAVVYTNEMPVTTRLIAAHIDEHAVYAWGVVPDRDAPLEPRQIVVVGTGGEFDATGLRHLDTVLAAHGYVFHIFERTT